MFRNCASCVSPHTRSATIVVKSPPRRLPGPPHPFTTELSWPVSTTQPRTEQRSSELCTHRAQTISSAALPTDRNHVVSGFANRLRYHVVSNCVSALVAGSTFVLTLVCVLWSFVGGRLRGSCVGPHTGFPVWAPVYRGVLAGTHRCATVSRMTLWQSANPFLVWLLVCMES